MSNPNPTGNAIPIQVRSFTPEQIVGWAQEELGIMYLEPTMSKEMLLGICTDIWRLKVQERQSSETLAKLLAKPGAEQVPDQTVKIQALAMTRQLTEAGHQAKISGALAVEQPVVVDLQVGLPKRKSNRVSPDGKMLYPDTDPKLPEHLAVADWQNRGHEEASEEFARLGLSKTPGALFGRFKPKGKKPFRHPQETEFLYNQETDTYCPVTETLMQTKDSKRIPIPLKELPPGCIRVA